MKRYLYLLAAGAMALSGCTSEDVLDEGIQANAIGFTNVVNKPSRSDGPVTGDLNKDNFDEFFVYGYYIKPGDDKTPVQAFNGDVVSLQSDGKWTYDITRYWIERATYHFYAYSCADIALQNEKGVPSMDITTTIGSDNSLDKRALAISGYTLHQHDLIIGFKEGVVGKKEGNEAVNLKFKHMLTKVQAEFKTMFPAGYDVKVSDVRISNTFNKANCRISHDSETPAYIWYGHEDQKAEVTLNVPEENTITTTGTGAASLLTSTAFVIPCAYAQTQSVELHFTMKVYKEGTMVIERKVKGTWSPKWNIASAYKYVINLSQSGSGLEAIEFTTSDQMDGDNSWGSTEEVKMEFSIE